MNRTLRRWGRRLPEPLKQLAWRARDSTYVRRASRPIRWGTLRRLEPISPRWGSERGTPIDRYYIDRFFAAHAGLITGRVLEVGNTRYVSQFGTRVTQIDIVDIDARNDQATIVADLADADSLAAAAFDCVIAPQTLVYMSDLDRAVANLWRSVAAGGSLLITTPAIARVDPDAVDIDRWHLTAAGLEQVISRACPGGEATVAALGNPVVAIAFLQGLAQEELRPDELAADHPLFPIVVTACVRKP